MRILITGGSGFIGTNTVERFSSQGWTVLNVDIKPPKLSSHHRYWVDADLRDRQNVVDVVTDFKPDYVLNLAAATGAHVPGLTEEFFATNTRGVENLIFAIKQCGGVRRSIFVSSLLVCENGYIPKDDLDYCAPNAYGESKVKGEMIVREDTSLAGKWVIARPSSVWGPWFVAYTGFFQLISRGLYFTIGGTEDLVKPMTFVGNAAYMFEKLLAAEDGKVNRRTYYLVDYPETTLSQWAEVIRKDIGTRSIPVVPRALAKMAATAGDVLKSLGWEDAPLTTFRFNNMLTGGHYPVAALREVVGPLPYALQDGVRSTIEWMRGQGLLKKAA